MIRTTRPLGVAAVSALLGLLGLGYAALTLSRIPANPPGDGFAAGLAAGFGLALAVTSIFALGEAGLLAAVVGLSNPTTRCRRLLVVGATAGGLAALPTLVLELARSAGPGTPWGPLVVRSIGPLFGAWLLLAAVGVVCSGLGLLLYGVDALGRDPAGA